MKLKKGYNIAVTSWENDGDYYNTKIIHTNSKSEVLFWRDWLELFSSKNTEGSKEDFGNSFYEDIDFDYLAELTAQILEKHDIRLFENTVGPKEMRSLEYASETLGDLAAKALSSSEVYMFRVFEKLEVFIITEEPQKWNVYNGN